VATKRLKTDRRVVVAGAVVHERVAAVGCIVAAGVAVARERIKTSGRVVAADFIEGECVKTCARVSAAGRVIHERIRTGGRVQAAGCVEKERIVTDGGIARAGCQAEKRSFTLGSVAAGIASVGCRDNRLRCRWQRKAGGYQRDEKESACHPQRLGARQLLFTRQTVGWNCGFELNQWIHG